MRRRTFLAQPLLALRHHPLQRAEKLLAAALIVNQNHSLNQPWGIGFSVKKNACATHPSARAFAHSGSTGTLCWAGPATGTRFLLLTTKRAAESENSLLHPVSNLIPEAVL
jgi:hypothetical protein